MTEQTDYWKKEAKQYREKYENPVDILHYEKRRRLNTALNLVSLTADDRILNVGVGAGKLFGQIPSHYHDQCVGLDFSTSMIRGARSANPDVPFVRGSSHRLPFSDKSCDVIFCLGVVGHLTASQYKETLVRLEQVLAEDGTLVISFANKYSPFRWLRTAYMSVATDSDLDYDEYKPTGVIKQLKNSGLTVEEKRYLTYSTGLLNTPQTIKLYEFLDRKFAKNNVLGPLSMTWVVSLSK